MPPAVNILFTSVWLWVGWTFSTANCHAQRLATCSGKQTKLRPVGQWDGNSLLCQLPTFAETQYGKISKHPVQPRVSKTAGKCTSQNYFNSITMCTACLQ